MDSRSEFGNGTVGIRDSRLKWLHVLFTGMLLYFIGVFLLLFTGNPVLFPTVSLIGSFAIPVSYVAFFYQHQRISTLDLPTTLMGFLYGGILGVFASAFLEPLLIGKLTVVSFLLIGFIEEFAKLWGLVYIAGHRGHDTEMDGLLLGAAAGMGFAALESNGYAFVIFLKSQGSLTTTVAATLLRAFLSPIGHGTWTAILASVVFRDSKNCRFRATGAVVGTYIAVSLLHALWDGLPSVIAVFGSALDMLVGQSIVAAVSIIFLWWRWRQAQASRMVDTNQCR